MLASLEAFEAAQVEQAAPVEVIAARIDATLEHDRLDHLPRITAPTMVIVADDDTLVPPYWGAAIAAAIPGARLVRIREGGHNCFRADPACFNTISSNSWPRPRSHHRDAMTSNGRRPGRTDDVMWPELALAPLASAMRPSALSLSAVSV